MTQISGKDWLGDIYSSTKELGIISAMGRVNGHAWYFKSTKHTWFIEICEDQLIEPGDLPLVGYGCAGWLYESKQIISADNNAVVMVDIIEKINRVFSLFKQQNLAYLPAVICGCSD